MFFYGFTAMLIIISLGAGVWFGIKTERVYQRNLRQKWINGESIEDQMKRDGWSL